MRPERELRRGPQDSSIPVPRFQRGAGVLNNTGGTYSYNGMVDYPRFPISEMHPENSQTLWNFKAGCSRKMLSSETII